MVLRCWHNSYRVCYVNCSGCKRVKPKRAYMDDTALKLYYAVKSTMERLVIILQAIDSDDVMERHRVINLTRAELSNITGKIWTTAEVNAKLAKM